MCRNECEFVVGMNASSWLGYSWDLADIVYSDKVHSRGGNDGCRLQTGTVSRREKFRLDAGPSRQELVCLHILSILRKIGAPSFLRSAGAVDKHQRRKNVIGPVKLDDACTNPGSARGPESGDSLESTSLVMVSSAEKHFNHAGNGMFPRVPCPETPLLSPSSMECNGNHEHRSSVSFNSSEFGEVKLKALLKSISWPFAAVGDIGSIDAFDISWENLPESTDPIRGSGYKAASSELKINEREISKNNEEDEHDDSGPGDCALGRGERKRVQVENIASALRSFQLKAGSRIVDFGCGSGALTLPLAALFPEFSFVGVDFKQRSISLLEERARKSNLRNVAVFHGRIENFSEPFDACVALHACGIATDLALLQALKHRAAYVMSPCCVGKLRVPIQKVMVNSTHNMQSQTKLGASAATGNTLSNIDSPGTNPTNHSTSVDSNGIGYEGLSPNLFNCIETGSALGEACPPRDSTESMSMRLTYPRSKWLRSSISENDFQVLARAADWSSYDHDSSASRLHSLCKVVLELDRNEASQEIGYWTRLFTLSNQKAGTVGVSHVLVGKSQQMYAMCAF